MVTFNRTNFFPQKNILKSYEIKNIINKDVIHSTIVNDFKILDISSIENVKYNSILFLNKEVKFPIQNFDSILIITSNEKVYDSSIFKNKIFINNFSEISNFLINHIFIHEDNICFNDEILFKIHCISFK